MMTTSSSHSTSKDNSSLSSSQAADFDMSVLLERDADDSDESSDYDSHYGHDDDDDVSISSITPAMNRSKLSIVLVLLLGISGGIAFCVATIRAEKAAADEHFQVRATQLSKGIISTVQEYEVAARSVHNTCRNKPSRREFRQFYDYLTSGGLRFGAAQCAPNVTHADRPRYEAEAKAYYDTYYPNTTNYQGFNGFISTVDDATGKLLISRIPVAVDAPFYFPVHYSEPVKGNAAALGLDTFSHPFQRIEILRALETHKPVLGGRLKVVQETDDHAYTVVIRHPGIVSNDEEGPTTATNTSIYDLPKELGVILVRIPSLLERRAEEQKESIACYLYDVSPHNTEEGRPLYLGSAQFVVTIADGTLNTKAIFPPDEVEYETVLQDPSHHRIMQVDIPIADGSWKLVVTPIATDDSFDVSKAETIFGGVMIFGVTLVLAVFLWRNMKLMHHIHKAKRQAEAERKIIASLYPETVVEQLLLDEQAKQQTLKEKAKLKGKVFDGKAPPRGGRGGTTLLAGRDNYHNADPSISLYGSKPIADIFPETTIMFADMVGFTAWSDSREPTEVFTLLEYVYSAFDMLAKKRRVFKVETVGDCYVAVVGLPHARKDHAIVMCKFASECLMKMRSVTLELAPILGKDTATLSLRVGLHSGKVTGGVLRGEKGRYQLFGDSMNTAARMEHHGSPGKIHVSPTTAECIQTSGKGRWLTIREDKIHAKGKGEMTTYWVKVNEGSIVTGISRLSSVSSSHHSVESDSIIIGNNSAAAGGAAAAGNQKQKSQDEYPCSSLPSSEQHIVRKSELFGIATVVEV